jgi:hypothetical protein
VTLLLPLALALSSACARPQSNGLAKPEVAADALQVVAHVLGTIPPAARIGDLEIAEHPPSQTEKEAAFARISELLTRFGVDAGGSASGKPSAKRIQDLAQQFAPKSKYEYRSRELVWVALPFVEMLSHGTVVSAADPAADTYFHTYVSDDDVIACRMLDAKDREFGRHPIDNWSSGVSDGVLFVDLTGRRLAETLSLAQQAQCVSVEGGSVRYEFVLANATSWNLLIATLRAKQLFAGTSVLELASSADATIRSGPNGFQIDEKWLTADEEVLLETNVDYSTAGSYSLVESRFCPGVQRPLGQTKYVSHPTTSDELKLQGLTFEWRPAPGSKVSDFRFEPMVRYEVREDGSYPDDQQLAELARLQREGRR